ncbi:MAG: transaldolase family protein [Desulfobacterales bacterium]|jgi:transaldolase|nr:transaldolase family protein [Desulfobacterales bacterium]MDP6808187.1 transaldolase family protein [Desulfobacterales bacterium]|tara:strand:+ start:40087 stop:40794 length:708 start_codon:yes stop_codon:yes gene_type:complete
MSIFLDSSRLAEIEKYHRMGIIRGVTTNPTIMLKDGVTGGMKGIAERSKGIARMIHPLPVSVEVISNHPEEMIAQAETFASWADNINVKITIHGPNGELDNLEAIHKLETVHDIRINVTAMMSAQQCFLAAMAGATYVSVFGGRVNNMGYDACSEIRKTRKVLDQSRLDSRIIVGSTREVLNVIQWIEAGAHIVTVTPNLLEGMIVHPYSKDTVQMFLRDGAEIAAMIADDRKDT